MNELTKALNQQVFKFFDEIVKEYPDTKKDKLIELWSGEKKQQDTTKCTFITKKGTQCTHKIKEHDLCGVHLRQRRGSSSSKEESKEPEPEKLNKRLAKHDTLNVFFHPPTSLVLVKAKIGNKFSSHVVGVIKNNEVIPHLSKIDNENCQKYGFKVKEGIKNDAES